MMISLISMFLFKRPRPLGPLLDIPHDLVPQVYAFFEYGRSREGSQLVETLYSIDDSFRDPQFARHMYQIWFGKSVGEWDKSMLSSSLDMRNEKWFVYIEDFSSTNKTRLAAHAENLIKRNCSSLLRRMFEAVHLCSITNTELFRSACRHGSTETAKTMLAASSNLPDAHDGNIIGWHSRWDLLDIEGVLRGDCLEMCLQSVASTRPDIVVLDAVLLSKIPLNWHERTSSRNTSRVVFKWEEMAVAMIKRRLIPTKYIDEVFFEELPEHPLTDCPECTVWLEQYASFDKSPIHPLFHKNIMHADMSKFARMVNHRWIKDYGTGNDWATERKLAIRRKLLCRWPSTNLDELNHYFGDDVREWWGTITIMGRQVYSSSLNSFLR